MLWRFTRAAVGLAAVVALLTPRLAVADQRPAHVGIGIRLLDAPAKLVKDPRAHASIIDSLPAGAKIVRHVLVANDTGRAAHILLYPEAATIADGQFTPVGGRASNELTSWMHVEPPAVDLPQGGSVRATVTINVPLAATAGERYAAVVADLPPTADGPGVKIESRVGVRVYLNVGGNAPRVDFAVTTLTAERGPDGTPIVQAQVHNTGGRALDMRGTLWLRDGPGATSAGPFAATLGTTLAPGQSEPVAVRLAKSLPAGPWLAHLQLQSGLLQHAVEARIVFPEAAGESAAPVRAKPVPLARNRQVVVPVAVGLVLALLVALTLFLLWRRRRRRDDDDAATIDDRRPRLPGQRRADEHVHS